MAWDKHDSFVLGTSIRPDQMRSIIHTEFPSAGLFEAMAHAFIPFSRQDSVTFRLELLDLEFVIQ